MFIERLTLRHFRNYRDTTVAFAPEGAYITGTNGSGKTNLLEAIYVLANLMSFRTTHREELQGWGAPQCMVGAVVTDRATQQQSELAVHLVRGNRRLWINGKETREVRKFAAHFAAVAFHPGTLNVLKGGPAGRRYLIDRGIASLQSTYVHVYQDFQRLLKQRNASLRSPIDSEIGLAVWTERFIEAVVCITRARQEHIVLLNNTLTALVQRLGVDLGSVVLDYRPAVLAHCTPQERESMLTVEESTALLHERFVAEARRLQRAETALGQTLFGPQRDDVVIRFREKESRGYASQGEQRLVAFLLIAALAMAITQQYGHRPVILLDDVISELDARNRQVIFDFLQAHAFQVFITDVEERALFRSPHPFTSLQVRQIDGQAELHSTATSCHASCDVH